MEGWGWGSLQKHDLKESGVWVTTSAALSSPPGECLWYCGLGTRGPERRKRAGKIVLQSPNLPPTWQASAHKQDSYTNLVSDCSFDKTQVRTQEAGLQKRGWNTHSGTTTVKHTYIANRNYIDRRLRHCWVRGAGIYYRKWRREEPGWTPSAVSAAWTLSGWVSDNWWGGDMLL